MINKPISPDQLLETARAIYARGWQTIKLYFMIGQPGETMEDIQGIIDLCRAVLAVGRSQVGRRANLNISIGTLVPKPHTPFQWAPAESQESVQQKLTILRKSLTGQGMKLMWTDPAATQLECWLARGDRRMGAVIEAAWRAGARFDAWQDKFDDAVWKNAFIEVGLDPEFYTTRKRELDEVLPWDHINAGIRKKYLVQEWELSRQEISRQDCREKCYNCGILPAFIELANENREINWKCPPLDKLPVAQVEEA